MDRRPVAALFLAVGVVLGAGPARANMIDAAVRSNCQKSFDKDVKASGKPAPPGMREFACNCAVEEFKKSWDAKKAEAVCKARTAAKFNP